MSTRFQKWLRRRVGAGGTAASVNRRRNQGLRTVEAADTDCIPALRNLQVGALLGDGSFKSVYAACLSEGCDPDDISLNPKVLQVVTPLDQDSLVALRREVELMRSITEGSPDKAIVMPIDDAWECPATGKTFILQPRAIENLEQLGMRQAASILGPWGMLHPRHPVTMLFTRDQLIEAFQLAADFYNLRDRAGKPGFLIHGDMKPDNILILNDGRMVIADLGFSGAIRGAYRLVREPTAGFIRHQGCPATVPVAPALRRYYNPWQLEVFLSMITYTLVEYPSDRPGYRFIRPFRSVWELGGPRAIAIPSSVGRALDSECERIPKRRENIWESGGPDDRYHWLHFAARQFRTSEAPVFIDGEEDDDFYLPDHPPTPISTPTPSVARLSTSKPSKPSKHKTKIRRATLRIKQPHRVVTG
jgi:serine/threonine protein kinase